MPPESRAGTGTSEAERPWRSPDAVPRYSTLPSQSAAIDEILPETLPNDQPPNVDGDGPIADFRRWCTHFYPEWYHKQAQEEYDGLKEVSKPLTLAERRRRLAAA